MCRVLKPKLNRRVVASILKNASPEGAAIKEFELKIRLDPGLLRSNLHALAEASLISIIDDCIYLSLSQKIRLAMEALSLGYSVKDVCRSLTWTEFEDFCLEVLQENGFEVNKHLRFKACGRGWEIDLVAKQGSRIMLIDCKHWNKAHRAGSLRKAAEKNLACTKALLTVIPSFSEHIGLGGLSSVSLLPIILTLLKSSAQVHLGVPIVPISQFNGFIYELPEYMSGLTIFPVRLKGT